MKKVVSCFLEAQEVEEDEVIVEEDQVVDDEFVADRRVWGNALPTILEDNAVQMTPSDLEHDAAAVDRRYRIHHDEIILGTIHSDLFGPLKESVHKYCITFRDEKSRHGRVYFMQKKSEALDKFKIYKTSVELERRRFCAHDYSLMESILRLMTDNGGEYKSNEFKQYLEANGISHYEFCADAGAHNGLAEAYGRQLLEMAFSLLPSNQENHDTTAAQTPTQNELEKNENLPEQNEDSTVLELLDPELDEEDEDKNEIDADKDEIGDEINGNTANDDENEPERPTRNSCPRRTTANYNYNHNYNSTENTDETHLAWDYFQYAEISEADLFIHQALSSLHLPPNFDHALLLGDLDNPLNRDIIVPTTYDQAMSSPEREEWQQVIDSEIQSHMNNKTWHEEPITENKRCARTKWIFRLKRDKKNVIERFKARLAAMVFPQQYGIDFWETFSSVLQTILLRILLSNCAARDWEVEHVDIKTAFLAAEIDADIYISLPEGINCNGSRIRKLFKALYGIQQSPKLYNDKVNNSLINLGFIAEKLDIEHYAAAVEMNSIQNVLVDQNVTTAPASSSTDGGESEYEHVSSPVGKSNSLISCMGEGLEDGMWTKWIWVCYFD